MASETISANGYTFTIDADGTITARGELQSEKAQRGHIDAEKNGILMAEGDQLGHLVAARNNGPTIKGNIIAQNGKLNQSDFKKLENAENRAINDPDQPVSIQTERIATVGRQAKDGLTRPDAIMVNDTVTYHDGTTDTVHFSFSNISRQEQEEMNQILETIPIEDNFPDFQSKPDYMTEAEYARLMEATDAELPSLADQFKQSDNKKAKGAEVKDMGDRQSFADRIAVDAATKAKLAEVAKQHAKQQKEGKKPSNDDGGRERGDDGPGKLGRESGNKVGQMQANLAAQAKNGQGQTSTGHAAASGKTGVGTGGHTGANSGGVSTGGGKGGSSPGGNSGGGHSGGSGGSGGHSGGGHSGGGHGR